MAVRGSRSWVILVASALLALAPPTAAASVRPAAGAVVPDAPVLRWNDVASATRYNVQLFRLESNRYRKILSRWPTEHSLRVPEKWRYQGTRQRMVPARYFWYVFPWFGTRYGKARVHRTFVVGRIPANTSPPSVSGTTREGVRLTARPGTWTGVPTPTLTYAWQRCGGSGASCTAIPGARSSTYRLAAADIDRSIRVVVTATNLARAVAARSEATGPVLAAPPENVMLPAIGGHPHLGATLTASSGQWESSRPLTYTYRWLRCPVGGACTGIRGADGPSYEVRPLDVASTLELIVRATNSGGSGEAGSERSARVGVVLVGTDAADRMRGTSGGDVLKLGRGDDVVHGERGEDRIYLGRGRDEAFAGAGADRIVARDRFRDRIDCGTGLDVAVVDRRDRVGSSCEQVKRR
jgi:hemolysin type calcium-binding protein